MTISQKNQLSHLIGVLECALSDIKNLANQTNSSMWDDDIKYHEIEIKKAYKLYNVLEGES